MQESDGEPNEYMIHAMTIWQECADATNEFFQRIGDEVLAFAKENDLTVDDLAAHLGRLAGTFSVTAIRANPKNYEAASDEYMALSSAALELATAMVMDKHEEAAKPKRRQRRKGPSNG